MAIRSGSLLAAAISLAAVVGCASAERRQATRPVEQPREEASASAPPSRAPARQPVARDTTAAETKNGMSERARDPDEKSRTGAHRPSTARATPGSTPQAASGSENRESTTPGGVARSGPAARDSAGADRGADSRGSPQGDQRGAGRAGSSSDAPVTSKQGESAPGDAGKQQSGSGRAGEGDSKSASGQAGPTDRPGGARDTNTGSDEGRRIDPSSDKARDSSGAGRGADSRGSPQGDQRGAGRTGSSSDTPVTSKQGESAPGDAGKQQSGSGRAGEGNSKPDSGQAAPTDRPEGAPNTNAGSSKNRRSEPPSNKAKDSATVAPPASAKQSACKTCGKPSCSGNCQAGTGQAASGGSPGGDVSNAPKAGARQDSADAKAAPDGTTGAKPEGSADEGDGCNPTGASIGGLKAGKGTTPIAGGSAPGDGPSSGPEIHVRAARGTEDAAATPIRGKVISPEYVDPRTPAGMQVLDLCEEYSKGSPDDLYLEQMPPARRELIRQYFENLRQQLDHGAAESAVQSPSTQPATNP